MFNILIKYRLFIPFLLVALFLFPTLASAYSVSGVVDFTYTSYQTRIGNVTTSNHTFTSRFEVNTDGYIYDPRFLRLTAGVGYGRTSESVNPDSDILSYNVRAMFFPGRMFSWDLYAMQSTMTVQSNGGLSGYDIDTTSYGASLKLNLSKLRPRAGNNYINNSGNNNSGNNDSNNNSNNSQENRRRWSNVRFPDIFFSREHLESESKSQHNPLQETRDNTSAIILYRVNSTFDMRLSGSTEEYRNLHNASSYDTGSADLLATAKFSSNAELTVNGSMNERTSRDILGFENIPTRSIIADLQLRFKEQNRFSHSYGYGYSDTKTGNDETTTQFGFGYYQYRLLPELSLFSRINYSESEYVHRSTPVAAYYTSSMKSGGLTVGSIYNKIYSPAFLDPFVFSTTYDFSTGFSKMATLTEGDLGGGIYYQNAVNLGLLSSGWKYESMTFSSSYISRRDDSPMNNDILSQSYQFSVTTRRVPRTSINASLSYRSHESSASSFAGPFLSTAAGLSQNSRSLDYTASIDHALTQNLNLSAGAMQGRLSSNSGYTLSTLTSTYDTKIFQFYAQAQFNYAFTRELHFSASLREEERRADYTSDLTAYQATMGVSHRFRAIIISADWRWREEITDNSPRIFQQSLMVKLSRPF